MNSYHQQSTSKIMLVRPSRFVFNEQTSGTNLFQRDGEDNELNLVSELALEEFEKLEKTLINKGIEVLVFDDTESPEKPDAVFPNNWVSFHPDGTLVLYPMLAQNRRHERRQDIIDALKKKFLVKNTIDLSVHEEQSRFLEGTGSIVFDHVSRIAYACLSPRTSKDLYIDISQRLGYSPVWFNAHDKNKNQIYHTNVVMCIGDGFCVICLESISDPEEREAIVDSIIGSGLELVDISFGQMNSFAGNMLEIRSSVNKKYLAMSRSAYDSLNSAQVASLSKYCELLPLEIPNIERVGGGSVRCMLAEVFLQEK